MRLFVLLVLLILFYSVCNANDWNNRTYTESVIENIVKENFRFEPVFLQHVLNVVERESSFRPFIKNKESSAFGLFQVTKACAIDMGFTYEEIVLDPYKNILCGISYLSLCWIKSGRNKVKSYFYYRNGLYYDES